MNSSNLKERYLGEISKLDIPEDLQVIREEMEGFTVFQENDFVGFSLTEEDKDILFNSGLPSEYRSAVIFTEASTYGDYKQIGYSTAGGDPVCIKPDGQFICINHDNEMEEVLINSSIEKYFECVLSLAIDEEANLKTIDHELVSNIKNYWYSDREYKG